MPNVPEDKLLFAVTAAYCFLLRWSDLVLRNTALFQTTGLAPELCGRQVLCRCTPLPHIWRLPAGSSDSLHLLALTKNLKAFLCFNQRSFKEMQVADLCWIISDIFCIYFTASLLLLCLCLWLPWLQSQCLGRWFKYHTISLTCTDRTARANYIHLVMWLAFQVVNILWQHAPPVAAATHGCSYIIPQLRTSDQKHPTEYMHTSASWQCKDEKWEEEKSGGSPHVDMIIIWHLNHTENKSRKITISILLLCHSFGWKKSLGVYKCVLT